ncbi:XrtA/PEP-CTERM system TPR-repeat protein PrsT [Paraglaciecola sp. 20A4]|uniref:XrtA/PEP-CTERM system TPR-repeat protein PrsT n=1 Tax=Paraglaciecola sp. 20A4 TaxID=2687288 RepID=UPI00140BD301|nr:XrtA/PEP-CTERM system TPR-repeat protein PrsT [Paraglaciecola sp. 20A4]
MLILILLSNHAAMAQTVDYERALGAYNDERFDEAYIYLKTSLHSAPNYLPAHILMGKVLFIREQYAAAEQEFSKAYFDGADANEYLDYWGYSLISLQRFEEIIAFTLPRSLSKKQQVNWLGIAANACSLLEQLECAEKKYQQLLDISPSNSIGVNGLASIALTSKKYEIAEHYINLALEHDNNNANSWQLKGQLAKAQGNLAHAKTDLIHAFELDPHNPFISRNLADIYLAMGDNLAATNIVKNILSASPHDPFALLINSWLLQQGQAETVVDEELATLAGKINSLPSEIVNERKPLLYLRALVSYLQGNLEQAARDFTRLQAISEPDVQISTLLAKTLLALGKDKAALAVLELHEPKLLSNIDGALLLGELYLSRGKIFKGVELLTQLQPLYPDSTDVQLYAVKLFLARQKPTEGLRILETLLTKEPNNERILITHSVMNILANNIEMAAKSSEKLLSMQPKNVSYLNLNASVLTLQNKLDNALLTIEYALRLQPNMVAAQFNLANIWYLKGDNGEALRTLRLILQDHRLHLPSLLLVAKINTKDNEFELAKERYNTVLNLSANNIEAREGLMYIALDQHDGKDALYQVNKLLALRPDAVKYIVKKAQLHQIRHEMIEAEQMLHKLSYLGRDNPQALFALAKLYINQGDNRRAMDALSQAQALRPENPALALQVIEFMLNNRLTDQVAGRIDELAKKYPLLANVPFIQGRLAEQQQDLKLAQSLYEKALTQDPQFDLALSKLFSFASNGIAVSSFVAIANQLVIDQPSRYFPRSLLAQYYYYNHQPDQALRHYEALLTLSEVPDKAALLNRLAWLYLPKYLPKSADFAAQAYELDRENPNVLDTYGWTLAQQGKYTEALTVLREASLREATSPLIQYHLGYTLHGLSRLTESKRLLQSALDSAHDFYGREDAQALHNEIQG